MRTARELHAEALRLTNAGGHARARTLLGRALRAAPGTDDLARIRLTSAFLAAEQGDLTAGLAGCDQVLATADLHPDVRGAAWAQLATLRARAGETAAALEAFTRAEADLRDRSRLALVRVNRGSARMHLGDLVGARHDLATGLEDAHACGHDVFAAMAEHNLGYLDLLAGDLVSALRRMERARPVLAPLSAMRSAVCDVDRAEVLLTAGLTDLAAEALAAAVAGFGSRGLHQERGEAELVLARLHLLDGRPGLAARVAGTAARRFDRHGSASWASRARLVAAAARVELRRPPASATDDLHRLAEELAVAGFDDHADLARLLEVRSAIRGRSASRTDGDDPDVSLPRLRPAAPLTTRLLRHEVRAELAEARGDAVVARRRLRDGLAELQTWQATFGGLDLQTSVVGHGRTLARRGLASAVADGRTALVWEWAERSRALAGRITAVRPPADPAVATDLAALRALATGTDGPVHLGEAERARFVALRARVRESSWARAEQAVVAEPVGLDRLRAALAGSDAAHVSYLLCEGRVLALVVTDRTRTLHDLGAAAHAARLLSGLHADLDVVATDLPPSMRRVVGAGLRARLDRVGDLLWAPVAAEVGDRSVVLCHPTDLAEVPWTLLPGLRGRTTTLPRSGSSWVRAARPAAAPVRTGFVAGPGVARAGEEVRRCAAAWPGAEVLDGDRATAGAVTALADGTDLLHVAAHGVHVSDNPLFSGLRLADGTWFGYDVDQLARVPATVVLSACELGRSTQRWGLETIGMTAAWLHAGARTVVASATPLADDLACEVLAVTHRHLAAGSSVAEALARAASAYPDELVPLTCHGDGW